MVRYKQVIISAQGASFLAKGQMWMYANNLVRMDDGIANGDAVEVAGEDGTYYGTGFISLQSHILVRILSRKRGEAVDDAFFAKRIRDAWELRKTAEPDNLSNCRIIFGEADLLPGLLADRYGDVLVTQISSYGMEIRKDMLYQTLLDVLRQDGEDVKAVYERNDIRIREKEGLEQYTGFWRDSAHETDLIINENGLKLRVDIARGQKTGYFLDQKSNRMIIRRIAHGKRVLDCFSHTGGFALNAAYGGAAEVCAVDVSAAALKQAEENARLNRLEDRMRFLQADVFDLLEECRPGEYDIIILDPPAFTKSRKTVNKAYGGYKRINYLAMELLKGGGYLATCSCSRYMENALFEQMLKEAAADAGVVLKQLSVTQQNCDHPSLWLMDETSYLKFYLFQITEV